MYRIYADDTLIYDSRLDDYTITSGEIELEVNKSGSFTFSMYEDNPFYNLIQKMKTIVRVYRNNDLIFRGRVITDGIGFFKDKTFTCEGEIGFLLDSIQRPYLHQGGPTDLFSFFIQQHNAQVDEKKRFTVGSVTVTDPNDYINRSNSEYEDTLTNINNHLIDSLGGYLFVSRGQNEEPVLNYYEDSPFLSGQKIEFGENLLDFTRTDSADEIATAIIPLGAKIETENEDEESVRLTIAGVNDGLDYVYDQDAVDRYGWIFAVETWDDVTDATNLKTKAQQLLSQRILQNVTIEVSAVDLSGMGQNIDSFKFFSYVDILSKPHGLDERMLLKKRTMNILNPGSDTITLGYTYSTFTDETYSSNKHNSGLADRVQTIEANYITNAVVASQVEQLQTIINQTSESINLEVSKTYVTNEQLTEQLSTSLTQLNNAFNFEFTNLKKQVDDNQSQTTNEFNEQKKYIRFEDGKILIGESGSELVLRLQNDRISFLENNTEVAYFANRKLYVTDAEFLSSARVGKYGFIPRKNGSLSLKKVVE